MDNILIINNDINEQFLCKDIANPVGFERATTRAVYLDPPARGGTMYLGSKPGRRVLSWQGLIKEDIAENRRLFEWGKKLMQSFADGIKAAVGAIVDAFKAGMDRAKGMVKGESPPKEGPFRKIDDWGYNVGQAWVEGMKEAIAGFSMESPTLAIARTSQNDRDWET